MSYLVLARKYRPVGFDAFVGQDVIAETLRNAISADRVAHAYLFCGPRGVGKTSMARVFAKALNCEKGPTPNPCGKCERCLSIASGQDVDVIEIDGASNRGIDEVREIRQNARYAATHSRFKIYYIDEVHMLTEPAFNALLKTLEEPPPHVKFIFATTAAAKLPETILSRVQRFDFHRISNADITRKLKEICKAEKLKVPDDVLALTARRARGSMRDSLSLLDQILSFCGDQPDLDAVAGLLGTLGDEEMARLFGMVRAKDAAGLLKLTDELLSRGMDVGELIQQLVGFARDLLVARLCGADSDLLDRPAESAAAIAALAKEMSPEQLLYVAEVLQAAMRRVKEGQDERVVLEMALVKLSQSEGLAPVGELLERLAALEETLDAPSAAAARPAPTVVRQDNLHYAARPPATPQPAANAQKAEAVLPDVQPISSPDEFWPALLRAVQERYMLLYVYLGQGTLGPVTAGDVTILFAPDRSNARKELETPEHRRELQALASALLGRPVQLRMGAAGQAAAGALPPNGRPTSDDPNVQQVIRLFKGQIVSKE